MQEEEKLLLSTEDKKKQDAAWSIWKKSGVEDRHKRPTKEEQEELLLHKGFASKLHKASKVVMEGGIVVLLGDRGTGKTQCGVELIRMVCREKQRLCAYVRCREIGMKLREAYKHGSTITERDAINLYVNPYLLVIDEVQERSDTDWERRALTLLIDKRYGAIKPTVLIANSTEEQFAEYIGDSILDRIKEGGGSLMFNWGSFRSKR